jgi:hypothetical protein
VIKYKTASAGDTTKLGTWLSILTAANTGVEVTGATLNTVGATTIGDGSTFRYCSLLSFSGHFIGGSIDIGSLVALQPGQTLTNCKIGSDVTMDLSLIVPTSVVPYTAQDCEFRNGFSSFPITSDSSPAVNPDGSNTIDMTNFPWAGVVVIDDPTNELYTVVGPFGQPVTIAPAGVTQVIKDHTASGGNIYMDAVTGGTVSIGTAASPTMTFSFGAGRFNQSSYLIVLA